MGTCAVERKPTDLLVFSVALRGVIVASSGEQADVERRLDDVMEELLHLQSADPSIEATLEDGSVRISVTVTAADPLQAANEASGLIRAAVHAAGGGTPDWPDAGHRAWSMRLLGVSANQAAA